MMRIEIRKDYDHLLMEALSKADKALVLRYLKSYDPTAAAGYTMVDEVTGEDTGVYLLAYEDDKYAWDNRDIYHLEKYDLALRDDFIEHVKKRLYYGVKIPYSITNNLKEAYAEAMSDESDDIVSREIKRLSGV